MDFFIVSPSNPQLYKNGTPINGIRQATWIERYREGDEFTIEGKASDNLLEQIPIGSLISHLETRHLMVVENHEVVDELGSESLVKITGRGFDTFLEHRVAVANNFPMFNPVTEEKFVYDLVVAPSWDQAVELIREHTQSTYQLLDGMDNIPGINVYATNVLDSDATQIVRAIKPGNVYQRVLEILAYSDLGIKTLRPTAGIFTLDMIIHGGAIKYTTVKFTGEDIAKADYLWSNKSYKNGAIVQGKFVTKVIRPVGLAGLDVKMLYVDATDFENKPANSGTGTDFGVNSFNEGVLTARGEDALRARNKVQISNVKISSNTSFQYRKHYDIGDIVMVVGNYGATEPMRVTEYVELYDKQNGKSGYPTLSKYLQS